ncbi:MULTISPECIES: trans-aconitate 2-methyltransferase [unclassified Cupriavidus]|uniref:trans-aconitate 2-methyltransferase n=1 Tax=unclassified Cupriavidus TaxID=2640874 RepID=UPI0013651C57|nr:trans-aconitate 2-methyltransferase [Cupriavidus sp. SW-Y-13]MWL85834.1 trans-aconitate 2-methyltransferase [Cupriavidus sp. SW-Y-13]
MTWSASQYVQFEDERTRPVRDLVAAIPPVDARRVVDIGCGPGNSTEVLAARFVDAEVTGVDSDTDMIAAARKRLPDLHFDIADATQWNDAGPWDVMLANAVFQWVPDHATLFPSLVSRLTPGGSLAVQMPDNLNEPPHLLMRETAMNGPWSAKLTEAAGTRTALPSERWYYELLKPHCSRVDIWRTIYQHPLKGGAAAVVEWFKGSGLRPFLAPLDETEKAAYLRQYETALAKVFPALPDGTVLLPFPRVFIVATR